MIKEKLNRSEPISIYRGEICHGQVITTVMMIGKDVSVRYIDGDISTETYTWSYKKDQDSGNYVITQIKVLQTPLDAQFGQNPPNVKEFKVRAKNEREAQEALIEKIVAPHVCPGKYSMPFDVQSVREGLSKAFSEE